jgi:hypothetical protein
VHVAAYKALEVLEERFGSEAAAKAALGQEFKRAKKAANSKRHIPENIRYEPETSGEVFRLATLVIRNYEQHLLLEERKKKEGNP